ncbi:hypothetical protein [Calderihabitans maritimus]|uniref:Nickel/cobalt efflux system n=1 Tax=Calderihabitans maritimus TaxID=1246530 RepID=A0A1Z5HQY1_9FIRM|nr:hypothetical protein [Calderihabitans maritimus]GAW91942.1 hypothetical protein KKC1_11020 [Calderihabitans maritimus]
MSPITLTLSSLMLGFLHGFDTDHVMEMTDFVSQDPRPRQTLYFSLKFGLGHTATVLVFGLLTLALKLTLGDSLAAFFEFFSGIFLILLGAWSIHRRLLRNKQLHPHSHTQLDTTVFKYGPVATGIVTGMAGTASILVFGPLVAAQSLLGAAGYILLYGLGIILAMSLYGLAAAGFFSFTIGKNRWGKVVSGITGVASIALGLVWIFRAREGLMLVWNALKM